MLLKNKPCENKMSIFKKKTEDAVDPAVSGNEMEDFDGFYFIPDSEDFDNNYKMVFFNMKEEYSNSKPVESSHMGLKYHLCFFKTDEDGAPVFDDAFEAILVDPLSYIRNMTGTGIGGCVLKKTEKSDGWWTDYLDYITGGEFKQKVKEAFGSIANN